MNLRFPLPSRVLHPNSRPHWAALARAKKAARELGRREAFKALKDVEGIPLITGYRLRPFYRDARRRDLDGLISSAKSVLDGIADSFQQDDSAWRCLEPIASKDIKDPHLIIELELEYLT